MIKNYVVICYRDFSILWFSGFSCTTVFYLSDTTTTTTTTTSTSNSGSSVSNNVDKQTKINFDIHPSHTNHGVIGLQAEEVSVKNDTTTRKVNGRMKTDIK